MKILFISSSHFDYLEDLTFSGLTEILGEENVIPYPKVFKYYLRKHSYPKNIALSRNLSRIIPDYFQQKKLIKQEDFDLVIVGSVKKDTIENFFRIQKSLRKKLHVILLDGGDRPEVGGDAIRNNFKKLFDEFMKTASPGLIFKREFLKDEMYSGNVFPLPFSYKPQKINQQPKMYDVAFWATESHPVRTEVLKLLKGRFDCNENGTTTGLGFKSYRRKGLHYLEELSAVKISYNFRGTGWDTLRFWEIPGTASFMISGKPGIKIPNEFVHGEHVIYCKDDLSDLLDLTKYYLKHDKEREEIAESGNRHLLQYHTHIKHAEYFIDVVNHKLIKKF
jgi:hypothetical protein